MQDGPGAFSECSPHPTPTPEGCLAVCKEPQPSGSSSGFPPTPPRGRDSPPGETSVKGLSPDCLGELLGRGDSLSKMETDRWPVVGRLTGALNALDVCMLVGCSERRPRRWSVLTLAAPSAAGTSDALHLCSTVWIRACCKTPSHCLPRRKADVSR